MHPKRTTEPSILDDRAFPRLRFAATKQSAPSPTNFRREYSCRDLVLATTIRQLNCLISTSLTYLSPRPCKVFSSYSNRYILMTTTSITRSHWSVRLNACDMAERGSSASATIYVHGGPEKKTCTKFNAPPFCNRLQ